MGALAAASVEFLDPAGVSSGQLVLSAVSLVLLAASGYLGGMLAFRYGVRVADEETQAEGFRPLQ